LVVMTAQRFALTVAAVLAAVVPAVAQPSSAPAASGPTTPEGIRRDPAGRTGISPGWEAIKRGDTAYVAHDVNTAIREYQAAVQAQPQLAMAHYRLGCALVAKNQVKEAQQSLESAVRLAQSDPQLAAKALFVIAELKEMQQDHAAAIVAYKAYSAFIAAHPGIRSFGASGDSRQTKILEYAKLAEQSAQVHQRIVQREQLAEQKPATEEAKSQKAKVPPAGSKSAGSKPAAGKADAVP
jgi:tetratricopeptide (TPR) repeat protein